MRRKTKVVEVGKVKIGGNNPISIQSMTNTLTSDLSSTLDQIHKLEKAGCEIIRVSVPDQESAANLKEIKQNISIPLVADIHFDYKLALESTKYVDKLRINPGNIGSEEKIKQVVQECKNRSIPIRIGVNLGSLDKDIEAKYGLTAKALVESANKHVKILEDLDFYNTIIALKASDVPRTIEAYETFAKLNDYPLHLGVTEAGTGFTGGVKSAVGIGYLLRNGIGDTIRVSLSADPTEEIRVGKEILKSLKLRKFGVEVVACPTCARKGFDVSKIATELEKQTQNIKKPISIAIMGCAVNGPGEASEADLGVIGGKDHALLYKNGKMDKKIADDKIIETIMEEINNYS